MSGGQLASSQARVSLRKSSSSDIGIFLSGNHRSGDRVAAIDDDCLPGHEIPGARGEQHRGSGNLVRLADAAKRRSRSRALEVVGIFPQRPGKVGADEAGGDAVDTDIVRPELDGEIARE